MSKKSIEVSPVLQNDLSNTGKSKPRLKAIRIQFPGIKLDIPTVDSQYLRKILPLLLDEYNDTDPYEYLDQENDSWGKIIEEYNLKQNELFEIWLSSNPQYQNLGIDRNDAEIIKYLDQIARNRICQKD